jgi:Helix-turn-helix domain
MTTINRAGFGQAPDVEPLVVRPNKAMRLLDCRRNYLYDLINTGKLESYREGGSRMITVRSIHALIERRVRENQKQSAA